MNLNMDFLQGLLANLSRRSRERIGPRAGEGMGKGGGTENLAALISACQALMQSGGEATRILTARRALACYARLDDSGRKAFFAELADHYGAAPAAIHEAYAEYREREDNASLQRLFEACEPRRQDLLRRLNLCPGGTGDLVTMRADLLRLIRDEVRLAPLDADFSHLLGSWFNRGFLVLEPIDWNTPAAILEKIIEYEAVHEISDWKELRRRLDPEDRRCYAFFHPALADEPLIFVEVALCRGLPGDIQALLAGAEPVSPEQADTAVFYSISNCQAGLKGISFGNFLIKQVVSELQRELPGLSQFVTLSPVPGFARWLAAEREAGRCRLPPDVAAALDGPLWPDDAEARRRLEPDLSALAAHYLTQARGSGGAPLDPVARFHLGNGANLQRLHWPADRSEKGRRLSHGLMVNYRYQPQRIEFNHELYSREGRVVSSPAVRRLARRAAGLFGIASSSTSGPDTKRELS